MNGRVHAFPEPATEDETESRTLGEIDHGQETITLRERLKNTVFDYRQPLAPPPAVFQLKGVTVATKGNVVVLKGPEKVGKSAVFGAAMAATLNSDPENDTLGFSTSNESGLAVLHIDCEQSRYHHGKMMHNVMRRAQARELPAWFRSHCLRGFSCIETLAAIRVLMEDASAECDGIHSVFIDGFGDLLMDVNDTKDVSHVMASLMGLSADHNTVIWGVVHQNPGKAENGLGKARGVLGSELQRKCETILTIERTGTTYELFTASNRNAPIPKGDGLRYEWDSTWEMFRTDHRSQASAKEARRLELRTAMQPALSSGPIRYTDLVRSIMDSMACGDRTAKKRIKEAAEMGAVIVHPDGRYGIGT